MALYALRSRVSSPSLSRLRRTVCVALFALGLLSLGGCTGGQEIESCLFVIAMAVDPAPDGNLTVTVKALSGTQDVSSPSGTADDSDDPESSGESQSSAAPSAMEIEEPGYIVLSATAPSCLRALGLLSVTTPRTVNLSQLREIVVNRTLAETDATLSILKEIHSMFRANGEAVVVITPDDAGDFIRRQRAILGLRLSKYLEVLFEHYAKLDTIPPHANLSAVITAMESSTLDAAAVYAAGNNFDSTLVLPGAADTDRLPGHLPRTAPAQNEYMGTALFDGPRMSGVLTGEETGILCLLMGKANRLSTIIDGAQYKTTARTKVSQSLSRSDGALEAAIRMSLTLAAGQQSMNAGDIAARIEQSAANVLRKMQAASCDAVGFGRLAIMGSADIAAWEAQDWNHTYEQADVRVSAHVRVL